MKNMLVATAIRTLPIKFMRLSKTKRKRLLEKMSAVLIIIGILLLANNVIATLNTAKNGFLQNVNQAEMIIPDKYEQIVITIMPGDRAWIIQERLTPNEDVREVLYYVDKINGKSVANIKPGEKIVFLGLANK